MSNDGKVTVKVLNRRTKNLTWLPGKFTDRTNNTWYVLNDGTIKADSPPRGTNIPKMEEKDHGNVRNLVLDGQQNTFQWDKNNEAEAGFIRFFKMHPQVRNIYSEEDVQTVNPETSLKLEQEIPRVPQSVTEFEIEDHDIEDELSFYQADVEKEIMNAISDMDTAEIYNLAYRLGISQPHRKKYRAIFVEVRNEAFKQGAKFLKEIKEADEITTVASKATSYEIIEFDGANYVFGNQVLGSNFNQILSNLKNDKAMYEKSIKPAVIQKDKELLGIEHPSNSEKEVVTEEEGETELENSPQPKSAGAKKTTNKGSRRRTQKKGY